MRKRFAPLLAGVLFPVLLLTGCGSERADVGAATTGVRDETLGTTAPRPAPERRYEVDGTVLEANEGPKLCLGFLLTSLPPQCGDVPIAGWDWAAVEGEQSRAGTTWGAYHVVGTYDGDIFTVTDVSAYKGEEHLGGTVDFSSPCPEPVGGWPVPKGGVATQEHARAADAYAVAQPDYVASWKTHLDEERAEFGPVVFNALFTGDIGRHEAAIRKLWESPLCVVRSDGPTATELSRIRKEVEAGLGGLGLQMLWSQGPGVEPAIEIGVVADRGGAGQAALDERYGPGLVRLFPALRPLE
jgi:hypothetical protein